MRSWQRACPRLCRPRSLDVSKILSLCYIDHDDDNDNDSDDNEDVSEGESASKGADERGREVQEGGKGSFSHKIFFSITTTMIIDIIIIISTIIIIKTMTKRC